MPRKHILLIDDDVEDQEIFTSVARSIDAHCICTAFCSAAQALHHLKSCILLPDCIFTDLRIPGMSGQQFLQEIRQTDTLQHLPVYIFSADSNPETLAECKLHGATGFVKKANSFAEIRRDLAAILS